MPAPIAIPDSRGAASGMTGKEVFNRISHHSLCFSFRKLATACGKKNE